jgi:hypothetical protein
MKGEVCVEVVAVEVSGRLGKFDFDFFLFGAAEVGSGC